MPSQSTTINRASDRPSSPSLNEAIDERLDQLERNLPALPAAALRLQRAMARRVCEMTGDLAQRWSDSGSNSLRTARTGFKTVTGTARHETGKAVDRATTAARRTVGQAEAQSRRTAEVIEHEVDEAVDGTQRTIEELGADVVRAADAVEQAIDPDRTPTGESYQELTRAQLYRRASDLDIAGRSRMTKDELIDALAAHQG